MNAKDLFANLFNPNFNINNFFDSFFADVKETPYKMHARTVSRNGNINFKYGSDYHIEDAQDLRRQCQQRFTNINKLTIFDSELRLPPDGAEIILTNLLTNPTLFKVKYPENFFDKAQVERLTAHLVHNNANRKNADNKNRERLMLLLGATIGLWFCALTSGSSAVLLLSVALGGGSAYLMTKAHRVYLKFSASYYDMPDKITAVNLQTEQAALLAGLNAKNIGGYLKSFMIMATYRHPLAFAAGLFHSLEYNYTIKHLIRSSFVKTAQAKPGDITANDTQVTSLSTSVSQEEPKERPSTIPPYRISVSIATKTGFMSYTMRFSDQLSFGKRLGKEITEFTIHTDKDNLLPENGAAMIMEELLKRRTLISAKFPADFLNDEQNSILQTRINQNKHTQESKKLRAENREKQSNRRWAVSGTTLAIAAAVLTGQAYWLVLYYGAIAGFISYQLKKIHNIWADKHYQNKKSIETSSPTEKKALKFGVEAITWHGYFTSFIHWQTYRHPQAFATAMRHAEKENEKLVKTVRALP